MANGIQGVMIAVLEDGEELDEFLIVGVVFEDLLSLIAARNDVIERALELYARLSRHGVTISEGMHNVKIAIFKSDPNNNIISSPRCREPYFCPRCPGPCHLFIMIPL